MKKTIKVIYGIFLLILLTVNVFAVITLKELPAINGEVSRTTESITLADGTDTGVRFTKINLSGHYGNKIACITEFKLKNTKLSVDVINNGKYMVSRTTVKSAVETYNSKDKTVLSAINGDLWFTTVHSNTGVTKKVLGVPRGITVINGEIWSTQQFGMENYCATNAEQGTTTPDKMAFGVTYSNQPLVGSPVIKITVENKTKGYSFTVDGLNRLPALNSVVVYNSRVNSSNYALNDSYEIELETSNSHITLDNTVTATVKAIYKAGSETRPAISENTVLITARGDKIPEMMQLFSVGNVVSFKATITDKYGHTDLWQNIESAVGGHMPVLYNGEKLYDFSSTEYPTTLIGYKNDGTVMFCTMTASSNGVYKGLNQSLAAEFCKEIGYNSAFYLDGGGSTTSVVLKDGTYTTRNTFSDGSPRSVISSVAVVWNSAPVCEKQGSLAYIEAPLDLSEISPVYLCGGLLKQIETLPNYLETVYNKTDKAYYLNVTSPTNDPFVFIDYSKLKRVNAEDYPYIVLRMESGKGVSTQFKLYTACGTATYPTEESSVAFTLMDDCEGYHYYIVNMGSISKWKGQINSIRLDPFNSIYSGSGDYVKIDKMVLCKNLNEAEAVADGYIPSNSITDFDDYLESLKEYNDDEEPEPEVIPDIDVPDSSQYITDIKDCTTVTSYKTNNPNTLFKSKSGETLGNNDYISTGCTIIQYDGDEKNIMWTRPVVVKGDVDGNGRVSSVDALLALKASVGTSLLDDEFLLAADVDSSGTLASKDALVILKYSVGTISSLK